MTQRCNIFLRYVFLTSIFSTSSNSKSQRAGQNCKMTFEFDVESEVEDDESSPVKSESQIVTSGGEEHGSKGEPNSSIGYKICK